MITSSFTADFQDFTAIGKRPLSADKLPSKTGTSGIEIDYVSSKALDDLAGEFADIIPEQMGSFNSGHWGDENLEFLAFRLNQEIVGGAVMIVRKIPFSGTGIALLKWGPVFQKPGTEFDCDLYESLIACLQNEYCKKRNLHLTIMPAAKPVVMEEFENILPEKGFSIGNGFAAPERYIVNLQNSSEELMASLDQKWRYNLRKALKNDFEIKIVDSEEGLNEFMDLYSQMIDRKNFLDSSGIGALETMIKNSPEKTRPMIALVSHEGKVTAGGVFHVAGNMASYMFGATDTRALRLKAGYALHWWVAEYLIEQRKFDWYDLGGNDLDKGLHQFKKGFVGKSGHILTSPHRYHYASSISAKLAGFAAFQVRDLVSAASRKLHALKTGK